MKVQFENATIADSIAKAARVAPTRGEAFDKASGIVMELDPVNGTATLKATNLHVYYLEVVDAMEVQAEGEGPFVWRFHAATLAAVAGKLPIGSGKTCWLTQEGGEVILKSGRTVAKFRLNDPSYYPRWEPYDVDLLEMVPDLGSRIKQVEWAAMQDMESRFAGIRLDGEHIMATDQFRLAMVPCEATPIHRPVTIPAGVLKPIIANMRDVAVGIDGGSFLLMPDSSTQIRTVTIESEYPNIKPIIDRTPPASVKFRKSELLEIIERATVFVVNDRSPRLTFIIGKGEIAVMCADADTGLLGDAIEIPGQCDHARVNLFFTPKNLTEALVAAPSEEVEFFYDPASTGKPVKIDGGSGYMAVVMPRKEVGGGQQEG